MYKHTTGSHEKIRQIRHVIAQMDELEHQLESLISPSTDQEHKITTKRKVNDYSITALVYDALFDGKPRKVAQIAKEIKEKTGHNVDSSSVRGAAKYMASRGKLMVDDVTKEFCLVTEAPKVEAPVAPVAPTQPLTT